jgi:1-acyl-sn-glycerol-3-phosphate acyltransferase
LDEIANGYICAPRRFHFIGQTDRYKGAVKIILYIIYFLAGVIHLNRESEESKKRAIQESIKVLKKGDVLVLYPEGTRTRTGKMGKGKLGIAKIFLESQVPILPVAIKGTFDLLPPSGKLKIKRVVKINIGQPLYFEKELTRAEFLDKNSEDYSLILKEITNKVMVNISQLYQELTV